MPRPTHPDPELPPPLLPSDPGSFAGRTITEGKPQNIRQALADNNYPPGIVRALEALRAELASGAARPLGEHNPDALLWNRELVPHRGKPWLELPWYFAEAYFYRRLLEAVRYFRPGPWRGRDPLARQKRELEETAVAWLAANWRRLTGAAPAAVCGALLHASLWGNRADLSNMALGLHTLGAPAAREERHLILIDHTDAARALMARGLRRVDFVNDNVGLDLLSDMALADFLLAQGWVQEIVFHLKNQPFFVSDAMVADLQATLSLLSALPAERRPQGLAARLRAHIGSGRLVLAEDAFWTSGLMFRRLPPHLRAELARSDLVILKGDVNYRRLLDDRHWPHTTRLADATAYFPAPFLVLRTLKGEIMVGLEPGQAQRLAAEDPEWLFNGKRGIIHLVE